MINMVAIIPGNNPVERGLVLGKVGVGVARRYASLLSSVGNNLFKEENRRAISPTPALLTFAV